MKLNIYQRQTLIDAAIIATGSVEGLFALAKRNNLSITAKLTDGQTVEYELDDVVNAPVRNYYAAKGISPATDIDRNEYNELLYQTGTLRPATIAPPQINIPGTDDKKIIDKLDEILWQIQTGQEVEKPVSKRPLTRIFKDQFSEVFA